MLDNPWRSCKTEKPPEYLRIEIKDIYCTKYVGYRYRDTYFETIGNFIIENPYQWRHIPVGSYLWNEVKEKIRLLSEGVGVTVRQTKEGTVDE